MGAFDLKDQLAIYRSYHSNPINVKIHLVCIPILLSTFLFMLSSIRLGANELINGGTVVITLYGVYYIILDRHVGIPATLLFGAVVVWFSHAYYHVTQLPSLLVTKAQLFNGSLVVHIVSWIAQFYGHARHEHRAPLLLDNLLQAVVLAPFFVAFEVAFWLGLKKDIQRQMEIEAARKRKLYDAKNN